MGRYRISGLSGNEKKHLTASLKLYRAEKAKKRQLGLFYQGIMDAYGFDGVGRFTSHFETGLERVVWVILDERKEGYAAHMQYGAGDKITLLSAKGFPIRAPLTLDEGSALWAEYNEMCTRLGIDPKDDFRYYIGLNIGLTKAKK